VTDIELWDGKEDARQLSQEGKEVWVDLGRGYSVSNLGRFASTRKGFKILRGSQSNTGYILYSMFDGATMDTRKQVTAHRLVLTAFDGEPPEGCTDGRHLGDNNKTDNRLHMLEWGTRSQNMLDAWSARKAGAPTSSTDAKPRPNPTYLLDDYLVKTGLELHDEGVLSINDLARYWRCSRDVAVRVVRGETHSHTKRSEEAKAPKQKRRSKAQKEAIMALVREGKNAAEINEALGESLTPQGVNYYRGKVKAERA
jgi:hypothetical protein